jgi:hypothetical protein
MVVKVRRKTAFETSANAEVNVHSQWQKMVSLNLSSRVL